MALHKDLLAQAHHLATLEQRRPRQASLRRAVSAAYYALFHFLIDRAGRFLVSGPAAERDILRRAVGRVFQHGQMRAVSQAFARGGGGNAWATLFPGPVARSVKRFVALGGVEARSEPAYGARPY